MLTRRLLAAASLTALLLVGPLAGLASAHVEITAPDATQGEEAVLTFRVPTEKDVPTVKVEIALPTDTPIASVSVKPQPGWSYKITTAAPSTKITNEDGDPITEIVSRVTWTATAGGTKPGEFEEFQILADPLPKTKELVFKALQTYSDKSVVSWIQTPVAGAPEPAFPAPTLTLAAPDAAENVVTAADVSSSGTSQPSNTGTILGSIGLGVAVLALLGAGYAVSRTRRRQAA